jgi:hypothetical protein
MDIVARAMGRVEELVPETPRISMSKTSADVWNV